MQRDGVLARKGEEREGRREWGGEGREGKERDQRGKERKWEGKGKINLIHVPECS